jgi:hypothetical protein
MFEGEEKDKLGNVLVIGLKNAQKGRVTGERNEELVNSLVELLNPRRVWSKWYSRADARGTILPYGGLGFSNSMR